MVNNNMPLRGLAKASKHIDAVGRAATAIFFFATGFWRVFFLDAGFLDFSVRTFLPPEPQAGLPRNFGRTMPSW